MALVTYQVEPFDVAFPEIEPYLIQHWHEVALNRDTVPLAMDVAGYRAMDADGSLHILTARQDGALVGYHVAIVRPHLHYATTLHAFTDVYWLRPDCRRGRVGINLFREAERSLKARGVKKIFSGTKLHKNPDGKNLDMGAVFHRLGWNEAERLYCKYIGD